MKAFLANFRLLVRKINRSNGPLNCWSHAKSCSWTFCTTKTTSGRSAGKRFVTALKSEYFFKDEVFFKMSIFVDHKCNYVVLVILSFRMTSLWTKWPDPTIIWWSESNSQSISVGENSNTLKTLIKLNAFQVDTFICFPVSLTTDNIIIIN